MSNTRVRLPRKLTKSVSGGTLAEAGRLHPVGSLSITLNMSPLNRVSMTLAESDLDLAMHDLVEVYNQNGSVGIYRVTKITKTLRKERKIELSHGLDVFSDATIAKIQDWNGSVAQFLQMIIDAQTQKIGGQAYWQLGTCDDTNYWEKDIKYDNAMECLTEIAKTEEDFMFTFDQSTFPWTLNFVRRNDTVMSEFRLRRNTESCSITLDDSDLCTRLYLSVSAENEEECGGTYFTEGYYTFNDATAQAKYGIVCKTAGIDQSVFSPTVDLEAWKDAYFARHNSPNVQISIDGMELNRLTGESFDEMHLGRICRVALPDYGDTYNERIVSVQYPDALRKPNYVQVSLHNKRQTAEDAFSEISSTASTASSTARAAGRGVHNTETYWRKTIGDTANGLYSRIEMTAYYIRSEVVDLANGMYSRIEQTASHILSEVANTANGLRSKIEQTASYIRAEVSDTANGINSRITQTASSINQTISDKTTKAALILSITGGTSSALLSADVIDIDGVVTSLEAKDVMVANFNANNGEFTGDLNVLGDTTVVDVYANAIECSGITINGEAVNVIDAAVDGNTLKIWKVGDDPTSPSITFSKATTLSGEWSGSLPAKELTVTASPQGNTYKVQFEGSYSANRTNLEVHLGDSVSVETVMGAKMLYIPIDVSRLTGTGGASEVVHSTAVYAAFNHLLQTRSVTANDTYTPGSAYIGIGSIMVDVPNKIAVNSQDGLVYIASTGESSLAITATEPEFTYNSTGHYYRATTSAKAGDAVMHTVTSIGHSGTQAYTDGKTAGHGEMGVTVDTETGMVKAAQSETKELAITATTPTFSYNSTTHTYTATAKAKAGNTELHTASNTTGTEAYDAGNANRASQISGFTSTTDTAVQTLSANTKYKFQSQYKQADGTWANGDTIVLATPANSPGTVTLTDQGAVGTNAGRLNIKFYAKLNGTTKITRNLLLGRSTYTNSDGDSVHCVNLYSDNKTTDPDADDPATTSGTILGRISTESVYNSGKSAGAAEVTVSISRSGGKFTASGSNGASDSYELGTYGMVITKKTVQGSGWFDFTFEATLKENWSLGSITFYR